MNCPHPHGAATIVCVAAILLGASAIDAVTTIDSVVTINEVHFNPAGPGEEGEWIELHNQMGVNIDLGAWRLSGGVDFEFPSGTVIPGGGFLVVAKNPAVSGIVGAVGPWTGSLDNDGQVVRLRDNNDRLMDELEYGDDGDWPVAADGSGATLAKRHGNLGSNRPQSWTASIAAGGTPGAINFPPPPAPANRSFVDFHSTWKYDAGGASPAPNWNQQGYDDSGWASGEAAFGFGGAQVYQLAPPTVPGGIWSTHAWTADANSQISATRTYTHKIGLGRTGTYAAINGVTFDSPGAVTSAGANWSLEGAPTRFTNNGSGAGANNLPAGSGSRQLCEEFFYGNSLNGVSRLTLSSLTPGEYYIATFYSTGFGGKEARRMAITPSDSNRPTAIDQNTTDTGNGFIARYHYRCPESGIIRFDFLPLGTNATWHHYAFSNEVAAAFPEENPVNGVSIEDVSSELTAGFQRQAIHCVDGTGLDIAQGTHSTSVDGSMWLSNGTFAAPNDPLPATITFDLGQSTDLTAVRVWNFNESTGTGRGANQIEVLTAAAEGGPFLPHSTINCRRAFGVTTEIGERIPLPATGVRLVRFNIQTTHGGDNQFAGLAEVVFFRAGPPPPPQPVPYRARIDSLYNTGVAADGSLAAPGSTEAHYTLVGAGPPSVTQSGHPSWLGSDGSSQWIGRTANGADNVPTGILTYRTTFDLTQYDAASALIRLFVAVDDGLDSVKLNGTTIPGLTTGGFAAFNGPFTIPGPFLPGANSFDFIWSNGGTAPNPAGLRVRWDATAVPQLARSTLPGNPLTTYFRHVFDNPGAATSDYFLRLHFVADDGAVFYLNGEEIHRVNMPAGAVTPVTPASGPVLFPMFSGTIDLPGDAVVSGSNVLAVELHQAGAGDPDAFFIAALEATEVPAASFAPSLIFSEVASAAASAGGFFIEISNPDATAVPLAGWRVRDSDGTEVVIPSGTVPASGTIALTESILGIRPADGAKVFLLTPDGQSIVDGVVVRNRVRARTSAGLWQFPSSPTPGTPNLFTISDEIVISEIMYHHHPVHQPTGTIEDPEEWIELYNRGSGPVDLTDWSLRGGIEFPIPAGTVIAAGQRLVISNDSAALRARYPSAPIIGDFTGSLANSDDLVRLEDAAGNLADEVHYFDGGRWPAAADGGGSSLELIHPEMDNSQPESWAASDEAAKAVWQTFSYSASGQPPTGSNDPILYHEFITGLLAAGECAIDDISVQEVTSGNRQLIQNGTFNEGINSWRLLGNHGGHGRSIVIDDPAGAGNNVLKLVATGPTEHMHNHAETTLKDGNSFVQLSNAATYAVSFRARWISGSPRLHTRLYFNRAARQHLLPIPPATGTPGTANSRSIAAPRPNFYSLAHSPVVPPLAVPCTVTAQVGDPAGLQSVTLKWRADGSVPWQSTPMADVGDGRFQANIPAQSAGALVQFYVEALNAASIPVTFPTSGPASRALIKWDDGVPITTPGHQLRILLPAVDTALLHAPTNVMSNDPMPCTVIYRDQEIFYDTTVRLRSSERGRLGDSRVGFSIDFDPTHLFRGAHAGINLDRGSVGRGSQGSVNGSTGTGFGQIEIMTWQFMNRAGGIAGMYNDLVYVLPPRSQHNGSAMLTMAEFNDVFLETQYENGADTPTFKFELIYFPLNTSNGGPEGLKIAQPDDVRQVNLNQINTPADKESYRWNFLIGNARDEDDYSRIIALNQAFRMPTGTPAQKAAFVTAVDGVLDVDAYLRGMAALSLCGTADHYVDGFQHNIKFYDRSTDRRIVLLPWDHDFLIAGTTVALVRQPDVQRIIDAHPAWHRAFFGHVHDLVATTFNGPYMTPWANHFQPFLTGGQNTADQLNYIIARAANAQSQCAAQYPAVTFAITTNEGADFESAEAQIPLAGRAWVNVRSLRIQGRPEPLALTWLDKQTWRIVLPVAPGPNPFVIEALDFHGSVIGSDSITVTGTGTTIPASAANLAISEFHYHPAPPTPSESATGFGDPDDFEFIELINIGATSIDLTGCRFVGGITYTLPDDTTLAPGAVAVIPRRAAAFTLRHNSVPVLSEYFDGTGNQLSNGGESIVLVDATGADIRRFAYSESLPWPPQADGDGPSLVLIAPLANPDHTLAANWRPSSTTGGNPGAFDATSFTGDPNVDADADGLTRLAEYALGLDDASPGDASEAVATSVSPDGFLSLSFRRRLTADNARITPESSSNLNQWSESAIAFERVSYQPSGNSVFETWRSQSPWPGTDRTFLRLKITLQP